MDGALEAAVCCALAGHPWMPLGRRRFKDNSQAKRTNLRAPSGASLLRAYRREPGSGTLTTPGEGLPRRRARGGEAGEHDERGE